MPAAAKLGKHRSSPLLTAPQPVDFVGIREGDACDEACVVDRVHDELHVVKLLVGARVAVCVYICNESNSASQRQWRWQRHRQSVEVERKKQREELQCGSRPNRLRTADVKDDHERDHMAASVL